MLNKNNKIGVLMLLPALILLVILIVYPFVRTVHLSFLSQKIYQSSGKWGRVCQLYPHAWVC